MPRQDKRDRHEYYKERYHYYKDHGICPSCGCEPSAPGKVFCLNCLDNQAVCQMNHRAKLSQEEYRKIRDAENEQQRLKYKECKEKRICTRCHKRKAREGKATCLYCFMKYREAANLRAVLKRDKEREKKRDNK